MKSFKEYLQEQRQIDESFGSWVGQGIDGITRRIKNAPYGKIGKGLLKAIALPLTIPVHVAGQVGGALLSGAKSGLQSGGGSHDGHGSKFEAGKEAGGKEASKQAAKEAGENAEKMKGHVSTMKRHAEGLGFKTNSAGMAAYGSFMHRLTDPAHPEHTRVTINSHGQAWDTGGTSGAAKAYGPTGSISPTSARVQSSSDHSAGRAAYDAHRKFVTDSGAST
ncbi:MAG: hypothetical protein NTW30_05805 [Candidatus Aenigmarchaeota archaeon]|nr:hypothetical protein [Candidatus Aenigmarchaeota archaeon]